MIEKSVIQTYINNFRRHIASFLRPGVGLACRVHPAQVGGAILEFQVGLRIRNDDVYLPLSPTLSTALAKIEQHAFGGNLAGFTFGGTNVVLEKDHLIFIKDESNTEWSDAAAEKDVPNVLRANPRGAKMKFGPMQGTPAKIKNFFQDNGLNAAEFFSPPESRIKLIWVVVPSACVICALAVPTWLTRLSTATATFTFLIGCAAALWLAVTVQLRFKNATATWPVVLGCLLLMLVAFGVATPLLLLEEVKSLWK